MTLKGSTVHLAINDFDLRGERACFTSICRVKVDGHDVNVKVGWSKDPQKDGDLRSGSIQSYRAGLCPRATPWVS